jgi:hypothetical protein
MLEAGFEKIDVTNHKITYNHFFPPLLWRGAGGEVKNIITSSPSPLDRGHGVRLKI